MALCKNRRCMAQLTQCQWGDGYCSKKCMSDDLPKNEKIDDYLHDPTDPTGRRAVAKTADEVDAMLEAYAIDPRLPKIIYLKRRGKSLRYIGTACKISHMECYRLLKNVTPNLLRQCGLRKI